MAKLIDITGKAISGEWGTDDLVGNGVPVLRTTNFTNIGVVNFNNVVTRQIVKKSISEKLLRYGDIIIEKSGGSDKQPVGRVVFFEGENNKYLFNNFTGLLRVRDFCKWNPKYIFYSLFSNYAKGGTIPFENRTTGLHNLQTDSYVNSVMIVERKIEEQTDIVTILDKVNQLINYEKKQLEDLDILVKSRFIEMFGDPVSNPHKFTKVPLSELADIKIGPFGSLLHKEDYIENGNPVVNPSHIVNGNIVVDSRLTISNEKYEELAAYKLEIGDVVLGRRGEMGRCAVVQKEGFLCGTGSVIIRTKGEVTSDYIQQIISFPTFKRTIEDMAVGQTMPNLNVPIVSNFLITKPPVEIQKRYYDFVEQVDKSKLAIQKSLDELETLKKSLMQQYFG